MKRVLTQIKGVIKEASFISMASLFLLPLIYFPWLAYSFTQGKELTFKLLILVGVLGLAVTMLQKRKWTIRRVGNSTLFTLLCAQILIHGIANFTSENALVTVFGTFSRGEGLIMDLYLFAFILWNGLFLNASSLRRALKLFWFSALLLALYAILQKAGIEWFFENYATNLFQGRVFSFSGNPSLLGQTLALSILVGLYHFTNELSSKKKMFYAAGTLLMLLAVFFSGTRSAVLALAGMGFLGAIRYREQGFQMLRSLGWKGGLLLALMFGAGLWGAPEGRFDLSQLSLRSLESRFAIWEGMGTLIQEKWILGYGQETLYIHFPDVIGKDFFTLEENINISVDRAHNESLEEFYSYGIFGLLIYGGLLFYVLRVFFTASSTEKQILSAILIGNSIQNQLSFPDLTIAVLVAFAWGGLVSLESKEIELERPSFLSNSIWIRRATLIAVVIILGMLGFQTIFRPFMSHYHYTLYKGSKPYTQAVEHLKTALEWTPHFSELWYQLIFLDPSSMGRALANLEEIDKGSGDLLAWQGNFYAKEDPQKSADYFLAALKKNPENANWIRAFGDMLYDNGDCETASYLYAQYLEAVPDYWKWAMGLEAHSKAEQKSFETFFKHVPYFWGTLEKMESCQST